MKRGIMLPVGSPKLETEYASLPGKFLATERDILIAKVKDCADRHKGLSLSKREVKLVRELIVPRQPEGEKK